MDKIKPNQIICGEEVSIKALSCLTAYGALNGFAITFLVMGATCEYKYWWLWLVIATVVAAIAEVLRHKIWK